MPLSSETTNYTPPQKLSDAVYLQYYPSLNGLRALSILLVLAFHFNYRSQGKLAAFICNGALGVNVFFVISGFLITTLCLKEKNKTGTIALKNFYVRRILRIFPVVYLYLVVIFILSKIFYLQITWYQYIGVLFYITNLNYFRAHGYTWYTGHFWSLANEEQFYLIFPFILKKRINAFKAINIFIVLIVPFLCLLQAFIPLLNEGILYGFTHYLIKFQAISTGCLFSFYAFEKKLDSVWLLKYKMPLTIISLFLIFYLNYNAFFSVKAVFVNLCISLLTGYIIISNIVPTKDVIFKFLNWKLMSAIGILSYSIYIWQEIFTSQDTKLPSCMITFPYNIGFTIVIPILSYYGYESFFLKLKKRFTGSTLQTGVNN